MKQNINIAEILAHVPKGTKLWSPLVGYCEFRGIMSNTFPIQVKSIEGGTTQFLSFTSEGKFSDNPTAECLLFPSKENEDWSAFKKLLGCKHFEPYQKVLVASSISNKWETDMYRCYDVRRNMHLCMHCSTVEDSYIIPYEGNENMLGKEVSNVG